MLKVFSRIAVAAVLFAACSAGEIRPVDIEPGDMCSFCRMAISEKQFAAEMIDDEGNALKFDDVGCMLRYKNGTAGSANITATFVTDLESKKWVKAEDAFFVRSGSMKTPMGSGIVAYSSADKAGAGSVRFAELSMK